MKSVKEFAINEKYLMILKDGRECIVVCTYTDHRRDTFEFFESDIEQGLAHRFFSTRNDNDILDILEIQPLFEDMNQLFYK